MLAVTAIAAVRAATLVARLLADRDDAASFVRFGHLMAIVVAVATGLVAAWIAWSRGGASESMLAPGVTTAP